MRSTGLAAHIATAAIPLLLVAGVITLLITPVYRTSATVAVTLKDGLDSDEIKDFLDLQADTAVSDESLKIAGEKLDLTPTEARELKQLTSVRMVPDSQVLRITASGPEARQASDWANAVALTYVQLANSQSSKDNLATADQLRTRISELNRQVAELDARSLQNPVDRARLSAERDGLTREIGAAQSRVNELSPAEAENQARLLRAAGEPSRPIKPKAGRNLLLGALLGAAIGALRYRKAKGKAPATKLGADQEISPVPQTALAEPTYLHNLNSMSQGSPKRDLSEEVSRQPDKQDLSEELFSLETRFAGALQKVVTGLQDQLRADREHFSEALRALRDEEAASLETRFTGELQKVVTGLQDQQRADREHLSEALRALRDEEKFSLETRFTGELQKVVTGLQDQQRADREQYSQALSASRDEEKFSLETRFAHALQNVSTGLQDQLRALQLGSQEQHFVSRQHLATLDALVSDRVSLLAAKVGSALFDMREAFSSRMEDNEKYLSMIQKSVQSRVDGAVFEIGEKVGKAGFDLSSHLNGADSRLENANSELAAQVEKKVQAILEEVQQDALAFATKRDLGLSKRLARIERMISGNDDEPTKKSVERPRRSSRAKPSESVRAAKPKASGGGRPRSS